MDPESLLDQARGGDPQAWDDLLAWSRPFIRALLRRQLSSPDDASDLTNDVQVRMHTGFLHFRGTARGQLIAWMRKIAARVLYDHLAERRLPVEALTFDPQDQRRDIGSGLTRAEDSVRLAQALEDLPAHYRTVIEARIFEGLPPAAIAQRLGWPATRVRVYAKRAVEMLSAQLREETHGRQ